MKIGKFKRQFTVEPLELPIPVRRQEPQAEPEHSPAQPDREPAKVPAEK